MIGLCLEEAHNNHLKFSSTFVCTELELTGGTLRRYTVRAAEQWSHDSIRKCYPTIRVGLESAPST
jgi:hypothetical protein